MSTPRFCKLLAVGLDLASRSAGPVDSTMNLRLVYQFFGECEPLDVVEGGCGWDVLRRASVNDDTHQERMKSLRKKMSLFFI